MRGQRRRRLKRLLPQTRREAEQGLEPLRERVRVFIGGDPGEIQGRRQHRGDQAAQFLEPCEDVLQRLLNLAGVRPVGAGSRIPGRRLGQRFVLGEIPEPFRLLVEVFEDLPEPDPLGRRRIGHRITIHDRFPVYSAWKGRGPFGFVPFPPRGFAYVIRRVLRTVDRLDGRVACIRTAKSAPAKVIVRVRRRIIGPRRCYTLPAMRHRRLIVLICGVAILAFVFPVGAQSGMWPVTDAKGWFTISFPGDWEVVSHRAAVPDKPQAGASENPLSMVSATAPRGRQHLPALSVMTIMLPDEFSGTAFSLLARFRRSQTHWLR